MSDSIYAQPEYRAALAQEDLVWNAAFIPGVKESIGGVEVLPFTPAQHLRLKLGGSPFVLATRRAITKKDVALFLWQVSPRYCRSEWKKFWFMRSLRRKDFPAMAEQIRQYVDEAFQDSPPGGSNAKRRFSFVVPYLHRLCPKYGTIQDVLNLPYKQIFQLWKATCVEKGQPVTSPSDAVRAQCRAKLNAQKVMLRDGHHTEAKPYVR